MHVSKAPSRNATSPATGTPVPAPTEPHRTIPAAQDHASLRIARAIVKRAGDGTHTVALGPLLVGRPIDQLIFALARRYKVTVGLGGSSGRGLLLGKPMQRASDIDLAYDSREPGFTAFRAAVVRELARVAPDLQPDFFYDLSPTGLKPPLRGASVDKLVVLGDGRMLDTCGTGLADLSRGILRFVTDGREPGISWCFRLLKTLAANSELSLAPETEAALRRVLDVYYAAGEPRLVAFRRRAAASTTGPLRWLQQRLAKPVLAGRWPWLRRLSSRLQQDRAAGDAYFDVASILEKIVKNGLAGDRAKTLDVLERHGASAFLERAGLDDRLAPLRA